MTAAAGCPRRRGYCLSGVCYRYTAADRAAAKTLAREHAVRGEDVRGVSYDGAVFLVEDGEGYLWDFEGRVYVETFPGTQEVR